MPELPEVEIAARNLWRWGQGHRIRAVWTDARAKRIFRPASPATARRLAGARLDGIRRVGKNLLLTLQGPRASRAARAGTRVASAAASSVEPIGLWSHLGMTGKWVRRLCGDARPPHARVDLTLDDGSRLVYVDPRMFGRLRWVPGARFDTVAELHALGPDPLTDGIDAARLAERLGGLPARLPIKVALLDQSLLAGVGNIQASEALFRARIDPRRPAATLSRAEVGRLRRGILASIAHTLEALAVASSDAPSSGGAGSDSDIRYVEEDRSENPFLVYDRAGQVCPRSSRARIVRVVQAGRATFYCPHCQRAW
jgi:formamidopyrimidine-DNA glycosylase